MWNFEMVLNLSLGSDGSEDESGCYELLTDTNTKKETIKSCGMQKALGKED